MVGDLRAVGVDEVELGLDAGHQLEALLRRLLDEALQNQPRRLGERLAVHPRIAGHPRDLRLPRQGDDGRGVRNDEEVGMGGRHVEPGCEPCEPRARLLHAADGFRRHQLGALRPEQVGEVEKKEFDLVVLCETREITCHALTPLLTVSAFLNAAMYRYLTRSCPESSSCRRAALAPWRRLRR